MMIQDLAKKAFNDPYFKSLFIKAEKCNANKFFQIEDAESKLTEKEFNHLLRFADILSHSNEAEARNRAYKVVSLLVDEWKDDEYFRLASTAILSKLGNFPGLTFLRNKYQYDQRLPHERELEKLLKHEIQQVPDTDLTFTDSQYSIFESLKNHNHFSFSGPTSLGKSFILESFIQHLVLKRGGNENIIVLVPTRALINQNFTRLKRLLSKNSNYRVLTHPVVPELFKKSNDRYIFVLTPERLISYLSEVKNPKIDFLFIDEAQKIVSKNDTRSPLYYHAILQAERKSIKLFFASPNIPNPEVFLQIFEKNTEETISVYDSPVAQNRYFIDLLQSKCTLFSDFDKEVQISIDRDSHDLFYWLQKLGSTDKNIVYCNTIADTIEYAIGYTKHLPNKNDPRLNELINMIQETVHKQYYLIDCLKKGIAFHFGKLPQNVRLAVEELFSEKIIDTLFCTSTLLEGVNLPAKNIFILSNAIGLSKFTAIDFWNLAGRAGRLTKELSGNIICMRAEDKTNRWDNPSKDLEVVRRKNIEPVKPIIIKGQENFYANLGNSLNNQPFTNKNASRNQKNVWDYFANIALLHELKSDDSVLRNSFIEKNPEAKEILKKLKAKNKTPYQILSASTTIKASYQNAILEDSTIHVPLPKDVSYESVLMVLERLYSAYNWEAEESGGHNPMIRKSVNELKYYAVIANSWINSDVLSKMIAAAIIYYKNKGTIYVNRLPEAFDEYSKKHINVIINELISDIENTLRFKFVMYFNNYYLLLKEKFGEKEAGKNWAEYLEYGTTDNKIIELQNIGFPRNLAQYILEKHFNCLKFDQGILVEFNQEKLIQDLYKKAPEYKEILDVIGFQIEITN